MMVTVIERLEEDKLIRKKGARLSELTRKLLLDIHLERTRGLPEDLRRQTMNQRIVESLDGFRVEDIVSAICQERILHVSARTNSVHVYAEAYCDEALQLTKGYEHSLGEPFTLVRDYARPEPQYPHLPTLAAHQDLSSDEEQAE